MSRLRTLAAAIVLAAACAPAATASTEAKWLVAGSDTAVWLIRLDPAAGAFDLAIRKADGFWQWVDQAVSGRPAAAVASASQLHVLFGSPTAHVIFDEETGRPRAALIADNPLWPSGTAPMALCPATETRADVEAGGILAIVPRLARVPATRPTAGSAPSTRIAVTTAPAAAGRSAEVLRLALFERIGTEWAYVTDWPDERLRPGCTALIAATASGAYVLVRDPSDERSSLARWRDGAWTELKLTGPPAESPPVAMLAVDGRLVLLLAGPGEAPSRRGLTIATFDEQAGTFALQAVNRGDRAADWPADAMPQVTRFGKQMAMIWQGPNGLEFGTCTAGTGQLTATGRVGVFDEPPPDGTAQKLIGNFMWIVLLAVFVPLLLLRPRGPTKPFSLPEGTRLGNLLKRLLAAAIDLMLIYVVVAFVYSLTPAAPKLEEMSRLTQRMLQGENVNLPTGLAVASIVTLVLFVAYCVWMEVRTGATLGKRLMKLRVVGPEGRPPTLRQCFLRSLLKVFELVSLGSPLFFLVLLVPIFTRYRQRFGDLIAHTAIVDARVPIPQPPDDEGADQHTDHRA